MQTFNFGARNNSIIQFAYTVDDIKGENAALHGPVADRSMFPDWTVCAGQGYLSRRRHYDAHQPC
jgi:hypothetical protein